MRIPTRSSRWAEGRADDERLSGILDRLPIYDDRDVVPIDLRRHGGKNWQIEPRMGYVACRVRDLDSGAMDYCGTMKQCLRWISTQLAHRLGARNLPCQ